ncbi:MAG: hypothetical protein R6V20_08775 [Desulfobia sp.]
MSRYSQELLDQTITLLENRTGRIISKEDARQAVDNISGFFRVLQEWEEAEQSRDSSDHASECPAKAEVV